VRIRDPKGSFRRFELRASINFGRKDIDEVLFLATSAVDAPYNTSAVHFGHHTTVGPYILATIGGLGRSGTGGLTVGPGLKNDSKDSAGGGGAIVACSCCATGIPWSHMAKCLQMQHTCPLSQLQLY